MVISQKMARKIFGNENPLGEALYVDDQIYEVTGVFRDREENGIIIHIRKSMQFVLLTI